MSQLVILTTLFQINPSRVHCPIAKKIHRYVKEIKDYKLKYDNKGKN
jgi:hypothetical protein